jgi:hypothetical protein
MYRVQQYKTMRLAMEKKEWVLSLALSLALSLSYEIFRTAINNKTELTYLCKVPDIFVPY